MLIPFKITGSPVVPTIKDTEFKSFVPRINANMLYASFKPYIEQAAKVYILKYLGETLYNDICTKQNAGTTLTATESAFLEKLQTALAHYAVMYAYPKELNLLSDAGVKQNDTQMSSTPPQWAYKSTLWDYTTTADAHLDDLLAWMEAKVVAADTYFNAWKASTAYTLAGTDFFKNTQDIQQYFNIANSRRTFWAMKPAFTNAAEIDIKPFISAELYDAVKTQYQSNTLSVANAALLPYVRRALCNYAVLNYINQNHVIIEDSGIKSVSSTDGFDTRQGGGEQYDKALSRLRDSIQAVAVKYREQLIDFLYTNSATYPLYAASSAYPNDTNVNRQILKPTDQSNGAVFLKRR
jgi:hypothetical protein